MHSAAFHALITMIVAFVGVVCLIGLYTQYDRWRLWNCKQGRHRWRPHHAVISAHGGLAGTMTRCRDCEAAQFVSALPEIHDAL